MIVAAMFHELRTPSEIPSMHYTLYTKAYDPSVWQILPSSVSHRQHRLDIDRSQFPAMSPGIPIHLKDDSSVSKRRRGPLIRQLLKQASRSSQLNLCPSTLPDKTRSGPGHRPDQLAYRRNVLPARDQLQPGYPLLQTSYLPHGNVRLQSLALGTVSDFT